MSECKSDVSVLRTTLREEKRGGRHHLDGHKKDSKKEKTSAVFYFLFFPRWRNALWLLKSVCACACVASPDASWLARRRPRCTCSSWMTTASRGWSWPASFGSATIKVGKEMHHLHSYCCDFGDVTQKLPRHRKKKKTHVTHSLPRASSFLISSIADVPRVLSPFPPLSAHSSRSPERRQQ